MPQGRADYCLPCAVSPPPFGVTAAETLGLTPALLLTLTSNLQALNRYDLYHPEHCLGPNVRNGSQAEVSDHVDIAAGQRLTTIATPPNPRLNSQPHEESPARRSLSLVCDAAHPATDAPNCHAVPIKLRGMCDAITKALMRAE